MQVAGLTTTKAKDLIYTTNFVEGAMKVVDVKAWFQSQLSAVSMGVIDSDRFGLITRRHLNQYLVSTSYNKTVQDQPVTEIMVQNPLVVDSDDTLDAVVERLCREKQEDEDFFNDIVVLRDGTFEGLLSVREVLTNHIENLSHLLTATSAQKQALSNKNKQLFDNNFKSGFMGSQYKMLFEEAYLPMLYFKEDGSLDTFNRRFVELTSIPRHQLEKGALFGQLFEATFSKVMDKAREHRDSYGDEPGYVDEVTMKLSAGSTLDAQVYFEATADKRRLMVNVLSATEVHTHEEPVGDIYDDPPQGRPVGKITQAINAKLVNEQAMGLARSVATNLIDREQSLDRMMRKLERIISVASEIETLGESAGLGAGDHQNLAGNLSDFSMIDLCQILSQGNKTGCLVIENGETGHIGKMYFLSGQIIHGFTNDGFQGIDSLPILLGMTKGTFVFELNQQPEEATIEGDTMGLLMEACQNLDERT